MKIVYVDTETTGLDYEKCSIIELAAIIEIDGEIKNVFNFKMKPFNNAMICLESLKINKYSLSEIETFGDQQIAIEAFNSVLKLYMADNDDKFVFAAYNANFDFNFVRSAFNRYNLHISNVFFTPYVDIMQVAMLKLMGERNKVGKFNLSSVAKYLGIEFDSQQLHSATEDAKIARKIFKKCYNNF